MILTKKEQEFLPDMLYVLEKSDLWRASFSDEEDELANSILQKMRAKPDFETVVRPVLNYLCENHHPHVTVIITPTTAELLEGAKSIGVVRDYLKD